MRYRAGSATRPLLCFLATLGVASAFAPGCGSGRPPPETFSNDAVVVPALVSDGGSAPPGCGTKADGSQCDCIDVALYKNPPTMYFVLDHSGSMAANDKWTNVRLVVAKIMRTIGPRANFGAMLYPTPNTVDSCGSGVQILGLSPGDPPSSSSDGPTTKALLAATLTPPSGGTPTAAALDYVKGILGGQSGQRFVILATDGAPNCNTRITCSAADCQWNIEGVNQCSPGGENCCTGDPGSCNDRATTVANLTALRSLGIPTYVIGLPGTSAYGQTLDAMAVAGGTALPSSPRYYAVSSTGQDQMFEALKAVAAKITATCVFDLNDTPTDPALVNVYLDEVVVPYEATNGWTIDGKTVTLQGSTCEKVKAGDALDVRVIAGCPRVDIK